MEQHRTQEHIATLCAAGTLGIAATGFALASEDYNTDTVNTRNITWPAGDSPGYSSTRSSPAAPSTNPAAPSTTITTSDEPQPSSRSTSLFGQRRLRDLRPGTATGSDTSGSRGSSLHRGISLRPRTADTRSTSERRDPSTGSSWLKRISTISTTTNSSPTVSIAQDDDRFERHSSLWVDINQRPAPNKLVKRSTSRKVLPDGQTKSSLLRRPATSHQRSITMRESDDSRPREELDDDTISTAPGLVRTTRPPVTWRPYFEHGYPRKRHSIGALNESSNLRTIPKQHYRKPTLILGSSVGSSDSPESSRVNHQRFTSNVVGEPSPSARNRLRRSLSSIPRFSRRRYFTDPVRKDTRDSMTDATSSPVGPSPISPLSSFSAFDVDLPSQSPILGSSPPITSTKPRFFFRRSELHNQSDPTTLSSDNDTRIFSDDDSAEYQSDTVFDSLTTRATIYSQRTTETPKADTIFNDDLPAQLPDHDSTLAHLISHNSLQPWSAQPPDAVSQISTDKGIAENGSHQSYGERSSSQDDALLQTPVQPANNKHGESTITPVLQDSPNPFSISNLDDAEEINWSPKSGTTRSTNTVDAPASTGFDQRSVQNSPLTSGLAAYGTASPPTSTKRLSIFDWSENQRTPDSSKSREIRPRTVHGKQPHETMRSRSSGRKAQSQLHFRSQSVPNKRENQGDSPHGATSKFGTWGLGHKPVSEEWSDDFEFDDLDEIDDLAASNADSSAKTDNAGSMRGVKVPQSIMDIQASVHVQFGQVQEFMLLVEELKRLRAQGIALNILDGQSKSLWDDAESIINLATINDDDEDLSPVQPPSTSISEVFSDDPAVAISHNQLVSTMHEQARKQTTPRRSTSGNRITTPGRPRGDSLAQAQSFLQNIHQSRAGAESSPSHGYEQPQKLPFDTQDLKDLVVRSSAITRALKDIVRMAQGVSVSPSKHPQKPRDPAFSQIFNTIEGPLALQQRSFRS